MLLAYIYADKKRVVKAVAKHGNIGISYPLTEGEQRQVKLLRDKLQKRSEINEEKEENR